MKELYTTRWLGLYEKTVERRGKQHTWTLASRDQGKEHPKKADAVIIVASKDNKLLVITKEYRPIVGDYEYGFPAGLIDEGETAEAAAIREFKEETGMDLEVVFTSPPHLYSSAGLTNETVQIVFGTAKGDISKDLHESHEDIEIILADLDFIRNILYSEVPFGAKAWCIFLMFSVAGHFVIGL